MDMNTQLTNSSPIRLDGYGSTCCCAVLCPYLIFGQVYSDVAKIKNQNNLFDKNKNSKYKSNPCRLCSKYMCCLLLPIPMLMGLYHGKKRSKLMDRFNITDYNGCMRDGWLGSYLLMTCCWYSCMLAQERKVVDRYLNQQRSNDSNNQNTIYDDNDDFWFYYCLLTSDQNNHHNNNCCSDCDCDCDCDCDDD